MHFPSFAQHARIFGSAKKAMYLSLHLQGNLIFATASFFSFFPPREMAAMKRLDFFSFGKDKKVFLSRPDTLEYVLYRACEHNFSVKIVSLFGVLKC